VLVMSDADNVHMLDQPNLRMIRDHLKHLFRHACQDYPQGRVEIAWSDPSGAVNSANSFLLTPEGLDEAAMEAERRNLDHRNIYVGVNPRKPGSPPFGRAKSDEVERAYFQFADVDRPEGIAKLRERLPLSYTMAVTTGRTPGPRVHPYWELEEPITDMAMWRAQQGAIADYFESDRVLDPGRVMRLAGTISYPPARKAAQGYKIEPVTLRTIYEDDEERPLVSSEAVFYAYPWRRTSDYAENQSSEGPQPKPGSEDRFDTGRKDPREWIRNITAGINLHNNARDLIAHMVNTGYPDWLIRDYLDRLLRPVSDGGTLGQIESLIQSARQKYNSPDPPPEEDYDAPPPVELYEALDFEQLAALPPVSYLIDKLITDYGLAVIYGDPASGKTFLALDMALHLAYGRRWHDCETQQTGILYIAGEGVRGIAKRVKAWRHFYGLQDTKSPFRFLPHAIDFMERGDVQKLARTIEHLTLHEGLKIGLIIIDTVAGNIVGDENDAKDMTRFTAACDALRSKFNTAIIGIHHCGKDRERGMRGSTALPGASDTIIEVTRDDHTICAKVKKQKDDDQIEPFYMQMVQVATDPLNTQTSLILKLLTPEEAINGNNNSKHNNNPTRQQIDLIFDEVERAWNANQPWSSVPQTRRWGRYLAAWIASNTHASEKTAQQWIEDWLLNGCLEMSLCNSDSKQRGLRVLLRPGTSR
jgi:hypothetical protein